MPRGTNVFSPLSVRAVLGLAGSVSLLSTSPEMTLCGGSCVDLKAQLQIELTLFCRLKSTEIPEADFCVFKACCVAGVATLTLASMSWRPEVSPTDWAHSIDATRRTVSPAEFSYQESLSAHCLTSSLCKLCQVTDSTASH